MSGLRISKSSTTNGAALEQLHAGFEHHVHEARGREDDVAVHLVILEESHVAAIEPGGPGRRRARQTDIEQAAPAGSEAAFAPVARFMPPAALVPRVGGQREQPARGRHRREIQRHAGAMQIHRRFEQRLLLALAAHRSQHRRLGAAGGEAFLNRVHQRGMRADFQPHVHAEIRERIHRRRKLHGLPHAASPMLGVARFAGAAFAGDGAEKRDRVRPAARDRRARASSSSEAGCISG